MRRNTVKSILHYEGNPIRPPSEASSIILQVAAGCPHNRCTFCGAYQGLKYHRKPADALTADLEFAARYCKRQDRVFLADGDCLALPFADLGDLLRLIRKKLPWVRRTSLYGSGRSMAKKSAAELAELKELGLARVYIGLESGDEEVLRRVNKGVSAAEIIAGGRRLRRAGLFVSVTVLLGLAGTGGTTRHAVMSARAISEMRPHQAAFLTLMLIPGTELYHAAEIGEFILPDADKMLAELGLMLENISPETMIQIHANHASNYLPISGRLPKDRTALLNAISAARRGRTSLKPEYLRGL